MSCHSPVWLGNCVSLVSFWQNTSLHASYWHVFTHVCEDLNKNIFVLKNTRRTPDIAFKKNRLLNWVNCNIISVIKHELAGHMQRSAEMVFSSSAEQLLIYRIETSLTAFTARLVKKYSKVSTSINGWAERSRQCSLVAYIGIFKILVQRRRGGALEGSGDDHWISGCCTIIRVHHVSNDVIVDPCKLLLWALRRDNSTKRGSGVSLLEYFWKSRCNFSHSAELSE